MTGIAIVIAVWLVLALIIQKSDFFAVRWYIEHKARKAALEEIRGNNKDAAVVPSEEVIKMESALRILSSSKVKGCRIILYLYTDRVERLVRIDSPSLAKKLGNVRVQMETLYAPITQRSTMAIARDTENCVREMIAEAKTEKASKSKGELVVKDVPKAIVATQEPEKVADAVVVSERTRLQTVSGVLVDFGVGKNDEQKPLFFVLIQYSDGATHKYKGWGLKHALEKSGAHKGDRIELTKFKVGEKMEWDIKFLPEQA